MDLKDKVIAVTGASSGIGEAIARACAGAGAKVSLAARREDRIAALAEELGGLAIATDVGDEDQARTFVDAHPGRARPHRRTGQQRRRDAARTIVNVSSTAGRFARAFSGVYNLTKFGVGAFSEALRQEVTESGVRVVVIEPGMVATELIDQNRDDIQTAIKGVLGEVTPLRAEDIANAVLYAVSQPDNVSINEVLVRPTSQAR